MSYISDAGIVKGQPLVREGETVGTEKGDYYGSRLFAQNVSDGSVVLLDIAHPGVKQYLEGMEDLPYTKLFDLGAISLPERNVGDQLDVMLEENLLGDRDIAEMEIRNRKLARMTLVRAVIRAALETDLVMESYLSPGRTIRDVWDNQGVNSDKLTIQTFTCSDCFTVRSINGPCLC